MNVGYVDTDSSSLRLFLQSWLNTCDELDYCSARALWIGSDFNQDFDLVWRELENRDWLISLSNSKFGLAPPAVRYSQNDPKSTRLSPLEADIITSGVLDRVHAWNIVAIKDDLPTICGAYVWGSVAKRSTSHGDVDISLMFRRSNLSMRDLYGEHEHVFVSLCQKMSLNNFLSSYDLDNLSSSEVEDIAFDWINSMPYVNASGLDQWDELSPTQENFPVLELFSDNYLNSLEDVGPGVKSYEVDAVFKHLTGKWSPRAIVSDCTKNSTSII